MSRYFSHTRTQSRKYNAVIDKRKTDKPNAEIITVPDVKPYLKIDFNDDDTLIGKIIPAARRVIEKYTGLALVPCEIEAILRNEKGGIELPFGPYDEDTIDAVDEDDNAINDLVLVGLDFPVVKSPCSSLIKCSYEGGYTSATLPADLKMAIIHQVCYMYENLGDSKISESAKELAKPHKRGTWLA